MNNELLIAYGIIAAWALAFITLLVWAFGIVPILVFAASMIAIAGLGWAANVLDDHL